MYTAEALIHIQNRDAQVVQIEGVVDEMVADPATIESELQLLTSPAFLRRDVDEMIWSRIPSSIQLARGRGRASFLEMINPLRYIPGRWLAALRNPQRSASTIGRENRSRRGHAQPGHRQLCQPGRGRSGRPVVRDRAVLPVRGPGKAAQIANHIAATYLATQVEAKYEAAQRATEWLSKRINELRGQVLEAEAKIVEYRTKNNLVDTSNSNNPITLQFFQLNTQLALAQAQRAEAEARLSQARSLLNDHGGVSVGGAGAELAADGQPARSGNPAHPTAVGDVDRLRRKPSPDGQYPGRDPERPRQDAGRGPADRPGPRNEVAVARGARAGADQQHGPAAGRRRAGRPRRGRAGGPHPGGRDQSPAVPDLSRPASARSSSSRGCRRPMRGSCRLPTSRPHRPIPRSPCSP